MSGPPLEGVVRDVTQQGAAVIETPQGLVLAPSALPGERVRVRVSARQKGVLWGEVERLLIASPDRIEPACALAGRCGGCPLMTLREPAQLRLKLDHVAAAVHGLCRDGVAPEMESVGPALGYRRRVRMSFRRVADRVLLGYRVHGSHQIVDAPRCPVLTPTLQGALARLRDRLLPELTGGGEIDLAQAAADAAVVHVECDAPLAPAAYRAAEALRTDDHSICGVTLRVQGGAPAVFGEPIQSSPGADGQPLRAPATGFTQANGAVNARLCELVVQLAAPAGARVIELYAGHGNLTVALAPKAVELHAFELDAEAAEACRANLKARALSRVRVHTADASNLGSELGHAEVLVLDPPRGGAKGIAELAERVRPARIVYVSCHMTTLARDLRALARLGYRADRVHALDMFPQTAHVEAVVRMVRESG